MRPRNLCSLLLLVVFSAPLFAQDVPVSTVTLTNAPFTQTQPAVASNGSGFLTVWNDGRSRLTGLVAARTDANGVVLDPTGIRVAGTGTPDVVWSGTSYVVLWTEQAAVNGTGHYATRVARINADGVLIDGPRTILENVYIGRAASNGSRIVFSYTRDNPQGDTLGPFIGILDPDANVIATDVELPHGPARASTATVTSNGSDFLATWLEVIGTTKRLFAAHLDARGTVVTFDILADEYPPSEGPLVASDGHDFVVFLRNLTVDDSLRVLRVDRDLHVVAADHPVGVPPGVAVEQPRVVWNRGAYLLTWSDGQTHSLLAVHLDANGTAIDTPHAVASWTSAGLVAYPNVASNGSGVQLVWNDARLSPPNDSMQDIFSRLIDQTILIENPERLLSMSAPRQATPAIATGGDTSLAVWAEENAIYASRMTPGGPLDGRGVKISDGGRDPHVVFDGSAFLIAWLQQNAIHVARLDAHGTLLQSHELAIGCAVDVTLAHGVDSSLLAWTDCSRVVRAVRIGSDGNVIESLPLTVTPSTFGAGKLASAWNGSEYLVAFEELRPEPGPILWPIYRMNIRAARITGALTLLDAQPIAIAVSDDESDQWPSVTSNGDEFLVTWHRDAVRAAHVTASGQVVESSPLVLGSGVMAETIFDGARYVVAWRVPESAIVATHVGRAGEPLPNDRIIVATTQLTEPGLALTRGTDGRVRVVYTRIATSAAEGWVERAYVRTLPMLRLRVSAR
jgi:hypothetical protein